MVGKNCALEAGDINFYIKKNNPSESTEMFTFGMNGSNKSVDLKDTNYYKSLCA